MVWLWSTKFAEQVAEIKLFNEIIFSLSRAAALTEPLCRSPIPALKWDALQNFIPFLDATITIEY
jgi:hypothetical protein